MADEMGDADRVAASAYGLPSRLFSIGAAFRGASPRDGFSLNELLALN